MRRHQTVRRQPSQNPTWRRRPHRQRAGALWRHESPDVPRNRRLERIGDRPLPFGDVPLQPLRERHGRNARRDPGISLTGRNTLVGLDDDERHARQIYRTRHHHLATASAELGRIAHEKGCIAAQRCGTIDPFGLVEMQPEQVVDRPNNRRGIRRPAAQSGPERHSFVQTNPHAIDSVTVVHQPERPQAKVVRSIAIDGQALGPKLGARSLGARHLHDVEKPPHGYITVSTSWNPSGRRRRMSSPRLILQFASIIMTTKVRIFYFCRMKFRTEIEIAPLADRIGYQHRLLAIGSCFAEHIAAKLTEAKFRIATNPTGILAQSVVDRRSAAQLCQVRARPAGGIAIRRRTVVSLRFSRLVRRHRRRPRTGTNEHRTKSRCGGTRNGRFLLLTFGTAWVYERNGRPVANCHRQPASEFIRRRLTVEEIVAAFDLLFDGSLANKRILLTVSPVRHIGDGLAENALSKAILRVAAAEMEARHANVHYFPAYEIVTDDLRDYRFYADDLAHPAPQAVEYIWEKFTAAALDDEARHRYPKSKHS